MEQPRYLTLFNRFDEQNRFTGFYFAESNYQMQQDSHGFSYLKLKEYLIEIEDDRLDQLEGILK